MVDGRGNFGFKVTEEAREFWLDGRYPSEFFTASNALHWITMYREPQSGRLDTEATADRAGVQIEYTNDPHDYSETTKHTTLPLPTITLNRFYTKGPSERGRFGHGMGHIFHLLAARLPDRGNRDDFTEIFCNIFGEEMALPRSELADVKVVDERVVETIVDLYGVRVSDVMLQFMRIGKL